MVVKLLTDFNSTIYGELFSFVVMVINRKYTFLLFLALMLSSLSFAQEKKIVQFSGIIHAIGSELPVPFVTIRNGDRAEQVYVSNHEGFFSFVAHVGDTVRFSSIGYDPTSFVIPHTADDKYTAAILMKSLVKELPMVTPFPWASIEEFNIAFMALQVGDDAIATVRKNVSPEALAALARITPRSAEEIQNFNSVQRHIGLTNKAINQKYANPLLNPFAWGSLINDIVKGDFSRKKLKY